jgi:hypothetical protein
MSKGSKNHWRIKGVGERCPHCHMYMQRRKRTQFPINKNYFYKEWDYCTKCNFVQHYERYKSAVWKENEQIIEHFFNI